MPLQLFAISLSFVLQKLGEIRQFSRDERAQSKVSPIASQEREKRKRRKKEQEPGHAI